MVESFKNNIFKRKVESRKRAVNTSTKQLAEKHDKFDHEK